MRKFIMILTAAMAAHLSSCVSPQHQFSEAVRTGNVPMAIANGGPGAADTPLYTPDGRGPLPMAVAIDRNDMAMADFLLRSGARTTLDGDNLAYFSAWHGRPEMARFFVSRGIGAGSDIPLAVNDKARMGREMRADQARTMRLIGEVIGAMGSGGGGGRGNGTPCAVCGRTDVPLLANGDCQDCIAGTVERQNRTGW